LQIYPEILRKYLRKFSWNKWTFPNLTSLQTTINCTWLISQQKSNKKQIRTQKLDNSSKNHHNGHKTAVIRYQRLCTNTAALSRQTVRWPSFTQSVVLNCHRHDCASSYIFGAPYASGIRSIENLNIIKCHNKPEIFKLSTVSYIKQLKA
jgi:hypothetical protein